MKRVMLAAGVLGAVVYLKLLVPGFAEEFAPLMSGWLSLDQITIPLPGEMMAWLMLP